MTFMRVADRPGAAWDETGDLSQTVIASEAKQSRAAECSSVEIASSREWTPRNDDPGRFQGLPMSPKPLGHSNLMAPGIPG
jgi:hypothetical protein